MQEFILSDICIDDTSIIIEKIKLKLQTYELVNIKKKGKFLRRMGLASSVQGNIANEREGKRISLCYTSKSEEAHTGDVRLGGFSTQDREAVEFAYG